MGKENICKKCNFWVDCTDKAHGERGFCLCRDLFTYTNKSECADYAKGTPMTDSEFERLNQDWLKKLAKSSKKC